MRNTYRKKGVDTYWKDRWEKIDADNEMTAQNNYPLKYALKTITNKRGKILEAGCGNGRILRFFHNRSFDIEGIDYINSAIQKLKKEDNSLNVKVQNILKTDYQNNTFDFILAFGLYHNFEIDNVIQSLKESIRILKKKGKICLSFRADNLQNYLNDYFKNRGYKGVKNFHKINLKKKELISLLNKLGLEIEDFFYVQNMPIIYKIRFLRHKTQKKFNENQARKNGYQLNFFGNILQKILMTLSGSIFCNVYVIICNKSS